MIDKVICKDCKNLILDFEKQEFHGAIEKEIDIDVDMETWELYPTVGDVYIVCRNCGRKVSASVVLALADEDGERFIYSLISKIW